MCISNIGNRRLYPASSVRQIQQQGQIQELEQQSSLLMKNLVRSSQSVVSDDVTSSEQSVSDAPVKKSQAQHHHITVQHNYHDHANDSPANYEEDHPVRGGVTIPFPLKLHEMLDAASSLGMEEVVSWQPHGRCFLVHKPTEFVNLLPQYFKLSKLASFQRQLNLYGFQRLTTGRDRGGYYHELFLRDRVFLSHSIQRVKVKGTGVRARSNPDQEPEFWSMPWLTASPSTPQLSSVWHELQSSSSQDEPLPQERSLYMNKSSMHLPLNLSVSAPVSYGKHNDLMSIIIPSSAFQSKDDIILDAFAKPFHYLDPFQPSAGDWTIAGVDDLLEKEADAFFDDFDFPDEKIDSLDIEDDAVFGDLLEQMIA